MALGSALVALMAVVIVTLGSLIGVSLSQRNQASAELAAEVNQLASALGKGDRIADIQVPFSFSTPTGTQSQAQPVGSTLTPTTIFIIWVMDSSGHVTLYAPALTTGSMRNAILRDEPTVTAALRRALNGQASEDDLPGSPSGLAALFTSLPERLFAAVPIYRGGGRSRAIAGAVAISSPPMVSATGASAPGLSLAPFGLALGGVALPINQFIVALAVAVALLAGVAAVVFARRLTRPLDRVMAAAARMGGGDYSARISIRAPAEMRQLAATFNEMATTIERDVREVHRQEELRRELVANVSHDLATPLTMIRGFTETLSGGGGHDHARREALTAIIAREAARLQRLVDQLREVALLEAGEQTLQRAAFHLPTAVEETIAALAPALEEKRVTLTNTMPTDLPTVFADGDRVTEVLFNLLDNALRHTPEGRHIAVTGAVEGQLVRISIADTGPGIPPADRDRVFERFYRGDPSRSSATGGSGLGLAIVQAIVEAHGGSITVDEGRQGGAMFGFTLPIHFQSLVGKI
jgi:signal transduction histidine kinase